MTKELYIVSRDVNYGITLGKHSGYMLVEKDNSGNIINIQTVDLKGGLISDIGFVYGNTNQGFFSLPDGSIVPSKIFVDDAWIDTNSQWATENNYKSKLIGDLSNSEEAFNKIKQTAEIIDTLRNNGFAIDYMPFDQNCNTWSKYVADLYLNGFDIFDLLNEDMGNNPDEYIGSEDNFPYVPFSLDEISINLLEQIMNYLDGNNLKLEDVTFDFHGTLGGYQCDIKFNETVFTIKFPIYSIPLTEIKNFFETASTTPSPLVLDLDGDGVETTGTQSGTHFDHDGNGFAESTGWAGKDDGILIRDINDNSSNLLIA